MIRSPDAAPTDPKSLERGHRVCPEVAEQRAELKWQQGRNEGIERKNQRRMSEREDYEARDYEDRAVPTRTGFYVRGATAFVRNRYGTWVAAWLSRAP